MAELLRTISGRIRSFLSIENAVLHHGPRIHAILAEKFNPLLPEGLKIDFLANMQAILELLRHMHDGLVGAESVLVSERSGDPPTRLSRDDAAKELSSVMLGARDSFEGVYVPVTVEAYGFPRFIGTTHVDLLRQGEHLSGKLRNPDRPFPTPRFGTGLAVESMAEVIEAKTAALRALLADAGKGEKMGEAAQVDKDRAQELYDLVLTWGARILQSYFILAGERKLAARIRPLIVRPVRGRSVEPGADEGDGATDDGPSGDVSEPGEPGEGEGAGAEPGPGEPANGQPAAEPAPGS